MAAFFGMATKYAEGLLAIRYRTKDDNGHISGGPMYHILHGMGEKWRPLAIFFVVAGVLVALFGIGTMTQVNSITGSLQASFGTAPEVASVVIALVVSTIILVGFTGFPKSLKKWFLYGGCLYLATITIIALHLDQLLPALKAVFSGALQGLQPWEVLQEQRLNGLSKGWRVEFSLMNLVLDLTHCSSSGEDQ